MFKVKGKEKGTGNTVTVEWDDGVFTQKPASVFRITDLGAIVAKNGFTVGPVCGPYFKATDYGEPLSALYLLLDHYFEPGAEVTGDVPDTPGIPPGSIA